MHSRIAAGANGLKTTAAHRRSRATEQTPEVRSILSTAALAAAVLLAGETAQAQTETVLYSFKGSPDGATPCCMTPIMDKTGNLYGTTLNGGAYNLGTVWKLTPSGVETVLWSFGNGTDGAAPIGMTMDKSGNLLGTTSAGGAYALGTAFRIAPSGTETVLWSFGNGADGSLPGGTGPVVDNAGNLYGTTTAGGSYGIGTVFEITSSGTEEILWNFGANPQDQPAPQGITLAKNGNLYGTSFGVSGVVNRMFGTVWALTPAGTETVLYTFDPINKKDGDEPDGNVALDSNGNIYGTCHTGASKTVNGTVFKLTPAGTETSIHVFNARREPTQPYSNTTLKGRKLYGTTYDGVGAYEGGGVWETTRSGKETVLHVFEEGGTDGYGSNSGIVVDKAGNLYGTTNYGGGTSCDIVHSGCGTVFKVTPPR
jgi:uncharacterized repeat protein (TIGR03803 family)